MQYFEKKFKKFKYNFEKMHLNHNHTFKQFFNYFFDIVKNSMNCRLKFTQMSFNTKQKNN